MMIERFYLKQKHNGDWVTPGISHGYGVGSNVELIATSNNFSKRLGDRAIIKIKGAAEWSGIGMSPEYFPTQYLLIEYVGEDYVHCMEERLPGRYWRKAVAELKDWLC